MGLDGLDGISPGGVKYRAPYGANKLPCKCIPFYDAWKEAVEKIVNTREKWVHCKGILGYTTSTYIEKLLGCRILFFQQVHYERGERINWPWTHLAA